MLTAALQEAAPAAAAPSTARDRRGGHGLDAHVDRAGAPHDAGLAFFYGGLVRSKNALNTMMMSFAALGFVGRDLGAGRLLARLLRRARRGSADFATCCCAASASSAQGHDSAPALHGLPGHVRDHHRGPDLRRDRGADAVRRLPRLHHAVDALRLRAGRALGLGRRLARPSSARSTSPAARSCTSTPASRRWSRRWSSAPARTTAARQSCRTTCPSCCSARACSGSAGSASTAAARSPPTRPPPWRSPTPCSRRWRRWSCGCCSTTSGPGGHRGRCRHGDRRRPRRDHAGGRLRQSPHGRAGAGRARRRSQLLRHPVARPHAARRFARRVRRPRRRRASVGALLTGVFADEGVGRHRRPALRQPGPARRSRPLGVGAAIVYSALRHVRAPQAARPGHAARAPTRRRRTRAGRHAARRGGVQRRRGRDPRAARCPPSSPPSRRPRRLAADGGRA